MIRFADPGAGRRVSPTLLPALFLLIAAAPAAAQALPEPPPDSAPNPNGGVEAVGFVGWISPLADLSQDPTAFNTTLDPYVVVGADVTYWVSRRVGVGVLGAFAPSELGMRSTQPDLEPPEDPGDAEYFAALANLIYRIPVSGTASAAEPYFAAGAGVRHVGVEEVAAPDIGSSTDPAATLAAGVRIGFGALRLRAEIRDIASFYESGTGDSRLQNDVAVTVGLGTLIH
ncbi:MAG: hypothetical protein ACRELC_06825 [Gemmatimonadota bacterium]